MIIRIIDSGHHRITARRCGRGCGTIVGKRHAQTRGHRGSRSRLGSGIKVDSQVSKCDRSRSLANDQGAECRALISDIVDFSDHKIAACIGGNCGGSVVSQIHAQTRRHGGHTGGLRGAIISDSQIAKSYGGDGLVECFLHAQSNRIDLDKFRRSSLNAPMLPPYAIAGIDHQLNAVDSG